MNKFSAMKAFVRVVEAGTFTKAADSLGVAKGQLSRQVQSLEEELQMQLLNRTTRHVKVTQVGAVYYEGAVRLLDEMQELESRISHAGADLSGKLRVDVPLAMANLILLPAMEDFRTRYPDVEIEIRITDKQTDLVGDNVDCAIRSGKVMDESLIARRIAHVQRVVCASPTYLERFGTPQHPSELDDDHHRVVGYFSQSGERLKYLLHKGENRHEINVKPTVAVNDCSAMLTAGLAGIGIVGVTGMMAAPHIASGTLKIVMPDWSLGVLPLYVVYPPSRRVSAKLRVFIDWVADLSARTINAPSVPPEPALRGAPHIIVDKTMSSMTYSRPDVAEVDSLRSMTAALVFSNSTRSAARPK